MGGVGDIVSRTQISVRPWLYHPHHRLLPYSGQTRQAQRIIARLCKRAGDAVQAQRQCDLGVDVPQHQRCAIRRHVSDHQQHREKLIEKGDIARDHHQRRNRRWTKIQSPITRWFSGKKRQRGDGKIESGPVEIRWQVNDLAVCQRPIHQAELRDNLGSVRGKAQEVPCRECHRKINRKRRALDIQRQLEVERLKIVLVNDHALLLDFFE